MENVSNAEEKSFLRKIVVKSGTIFVIIGIIIRVFMLIYYYYTHSIDPGRPWGDVGYNYNNYTASIYPALTIMLLTFFRFISFGFIEVFAFWAFLLDFLTVFMFYFVIKNFDIPKKKLAFGLWLINPFFFLNNSFSLQNVGYHITDAFFFFFLFVALIFYSKEDKKSKILFYTFLSLSIAAKIYTIPIIGFFLLKFLFEKDWEEMKMFLITTISVLFLFLIVPIFFGENFLLTFLFWNTRGETFIPIYFRLIPVSVLIILFLIFRFKKADLFELIIFSIVVTASVMFFSNPFVRYFQPLIFYGILKHKEFFSFKLNLGIIKGKITVDNHVITFILSIFAVALAYLVIILVFDPFYSSF
ncbi:MAG: hypothetical protein ACXABG_03170 [Promethearchaeota archaeon]|jgi:hypothetical protein